MATDDRCVSIHPYFKVPAANREAFRELCDRFVAKASQEPACLYYGFSFREDEVHCREGYADAQGALAHLANVGALLQEALQLAELTRLEVHGIEAELAQLRGPLAEMNVAYFTLECGIRR